VSPNPLRVRALRQRLAACAVLATAVACADAERLDSPVDSHSSALPELPASLSSVVTGGQWSDSGNEGFFRIVVLDQGWEHIRSSVFIQWLSANGPDSGRGREATDVPVQAPANDPRC
jgi:hypothetical protein